MNVNEYSGVMVFAEHNDGLLEKVSLELVGKGREIAKKLDVKLSAVVLGYNSENIADELATYDVDEVIYANSEELKDYRTEPFTQVLCDIINEKKPEVFFVGATYMGRDLAPRIAARLETGLTADCTALDIDEKRNLLMTRPAFGGNLMATIICENNRPQMSTVRPGVFSKAEKKDSETPVTVIEPALKSEDMKTKVIEIVKCAKECVDISEAKVIVACGRGIGCKENIGKAKELADVLGGTLGASRAVVDNKWIDKEFQVGQTGKTVKPNLYVACGISGAIQHMAGMQDSDYIIAINKDKSAPIMKMADLAIVGDLNKVLPEMVKQIKELG